MSFAFQYLSLPAGQIPVITLPSSEMCYITYWSGDTVNSFSITATDSNGAYISIPVEPGANSVLKHIRAYQVTLSGSADPVSIVVSSAEVSPETLAQLSIAAVTISGKVSTSIDGQTVGVAPSTTDAGTAIDPRLVTVTAAGKAMASGNAAPADGCVLLWLVGTGSEPTLGGIKFGAGTIAAGVGYVSPRIPVASGFLLTVAGATLFAMVWYPL